MNVLQWAVWLYDHRVNIGIGCLVFLGLAIVGALGGGMPLDGEPWVQEGMSQAQWEYYQEKNNRDV